MVKLPNIASEARDFAMLERNLLSHLRLAGVLILLSASLLLQARLPTPSMPGSGITASSTLGFAVAIIEVVAAAVAIGAGVWEYWSGYADMKAERGFLTASQTHLALLSGVGIVVFATCLMVISTDT
ncbi:uncharacterized protein BXZ73DRAFT_98659 [Epithele typhae]|uniref:uncharacterized protein n=1 Tax=Epithele typhae TaxID=378194 RepID=UPI002007CF67|nr:uncharacterized protein BXZ73DRAFT_98659 [Epithele typhae]KAH9940829.1 hypothetical protein BXZ73DRAFT_98659 [Epithele typhae]